MKFRILILTFILGNLCSGYGQGVYFNCGTIHNADNLIIDDEFYFSKLKSDKSTQVGNRRFGTDINIPILVHVIHDNGPENISDDQIYSAVEYLNEAFANGGAYEQPDGIDSKIQFCLAQRDSLGNELNGILRYESSLTNMSTHFSNATLTEISPYRTNDYLNIRIVREVCSGINCDVAGYAVNALIGEEAFRNGVVLEHKFFGSSASQTKVLVHEVGHFLGLLHTFYKGCSNDNCLIDGDKVCDTPPDNSVIRTDCGFESNSCTTDEDDSSLINPFRSIALGGVGEQMDLRDNYMDYITNDCRENFTQGQVDRMHWFINQYFQSSLSCKGCYPPCESPVSDVSITINGEAEFNDELFAGDEITLELIGSNYDSLVWTLNGEFLSEENPFSYTLNEPGDYAISVSLFSSIIECENITISVIDDFVPCEAFADFMYSSTEESIYFESTSLNATGIEWSIVNNGVDIFSSNNNIDSLINLTSGTYILCITVSNNFCSDQYCQIIDLLGEGIENCFDEIDNDLDGLIDYFDPDCSCNDSLYYAYCNPVCTSNINNSQDINVKVKWISKGIGTRYYSSDNIVVGDFIKQSPEIEILINGGEDDGNPFTSVAIHRSYVINGDNGNVTIEKEIIKAADSGILSRAIGDLDRDGVIEYVVHARDTLYIFDETLTLKYKQETPNIVGIITNICLADINGDGLSEIILGTDVYNHQAILLLDNIESGCPSKYSGGECAYSFPVVADITSNPGLEIAAGNKVFELSIVNSFGTLGNTSSIIDFSSEIVDGSTSLADINGDNQIDIISVGQGVSGDYFLQIWDPVTKTMIANEQLNVSSRVPPLIVDLDGDCIPEIIVALRFVTIAYKYNGTTNLQQWWNVPSDEGAALIGISSFDFLGDNLPELCIRDESSFKILDGINGNTLYEYAMLSLTSNEYPVIADVDNDGQAEIVIHGKVSSSNDSLRMFCFEADNQDWMPTRSVWNQYSYNPTYINEDLTIPKKLQSTVQELPDNDLCQNNECPLPYNHFLSQTTLRTQNGCFVYPNKNIDLELEASIVCFGDSFSLCLKYDLLEGELPNDQVNVSLFSSLSGNNAYLLFETFEMESDSICRTIYLGDGIDSILVVLNYDGNQHPPDFSSVVIQECDYENNLVYLNINRSELILDLGADITICESESITLNAGSGFDSYLWSDFSNDSIFNTDLEGLHFVEAKDECGRIYRDSINVFFDTSIFIDLGTDKQICIDSIVELSVDNSYSVSWFPQDNVSCLNCNVTTLNSDTSITIIVVGEKDGCYTSDSLYIEVKSPVNINIDSLICKGEFLVFKDSIWTDEGTYIYDDGNCDSIYNISLELLIIDTTMLNWSLCQGDSVEFAGVWLKESGVYFKNEDSYQGCDSIISVDLHVDLQVLTIDNLSICSGDSIEVFGEYFSSDTIISQIYNLENGCDSISSIVVSVLLPILIETTENICFGDSILFHDQYYSTSGEYTYINSSCDSLFLFNLVENERIDTLLSYVFCEGDSIMIGDMYFKESGIYDEVLIASNNCDSFICFNITLLEIYNIDQDIFFCDGDSVVVDGEAYKNSGTYEINTLSSSGCDSIINLNVNLYEAVMIDSIVSICTGDSVFVDGIWYDEDQFITIDAKTDQGCDSIVRMTIVVVDILIEERNLQICEGDSVIIDNQIFTAEGEYEITIQSDEACDSLINLTLQFTEVKNTNDILPICQGDSVLIESIWYYGGETVEVIENTIDGCDSIITLAIDVVDILSEEAAVSFCEGDSILLHNQWIKVSGEYPKLFQAESGCDSVFTYIVSTKPLITASIDRQICEGDSVVIDSEVYKMEGTFEITTEASNGCDSIIILILEILNSSSGTSVLEFCIGDSLFINDHWVFESGEYEISLQNNEGCDSIVSVSVSELALEIVADSISACNGDSILVSGNYYFSNQVVSDTLWDDTCPKLRNTKLSFVDLLSSSESIVICQGDTLFFGSLQIFEAGIYPLSFISESGCDSFHTIIATNLDKLFDLPPDTLLNGSSLFTYNLDIDTSVWSVSWASDNIAIACETCLLQTWDVSETSNVTLHVFSNVGCEISHTFHIELKDSDEFIYPNIFTPNGDGINDEWIIDMTRSPINMLQVYDRWGNKIYYQKNVDLLRWDGTVNSSKVNPGVYIFVLEYSDLDGVPQKIIVGDITVIR